MVEKDAFSSAEITVVRVLRYVGRRSWVESTLASSYVKGTKRFSSGQIEEVLRMEVLDLDVGQLKGEKKDG